MSSGNAAKSDAFKDLFAYASRNEFMAIPISKYTSSNSRFETS